MGLDQDDSNTPAREERLVPRDEHSLQDQAMGSKDPNATGESHHLYDSLGGPPVDPRGTLSEGGIYYGAGDQLQSETRSWSGTMG